LDGEGLLNARPFSLKKTLDFQKKGNLAVKVSLVA